MNTKQAPASDRDVDTSDNEIVLLTTDALQMDYAHMESRVIELEGLINTLPAIIEDDDTYGIWLEHTSAIAGHNKTVEATRKQVKDPYLKACGVVEGFFKGLEARNNRTIMAINSLLQSHLQRKRDAERARLQAEARAREEEARRQREEAEDRERRAREAEEAGRIKNAEQHRAKASIAESRAEDEHAAAVNAASQAQGSSADLARTRSKGGSLGTLQDKWEFRVTDIEKVKGAPIWAYVTREAKEKAIRAYMNANAPKGLPEGEEWQPLAGVEFYRTAKLQVRR